MTQPSANVPSFAIRGVASGVLFMAFFGTLWASIGVGGLQGWGGAGLSIAVIAIGIVLVVGGFLLLRAARRLPEAVGPAESGPDKRTGMWFMIVFATEGILIAVASVICNAIGRFDLFFPIMAIIVGLHFLPLAGLFGVKPYYLVGTLLCVLGVVTLLVVPRSATLGGQPIDAQLVVLGLGAALILWSVGVGLWLLGRRLLASSTPIRP